MAESNNDSYSEFPAALIAAREAKGLSQAELGKRIGRSQQGVAKWERGEAFPTRKSMAALVQVLPELARLSPFFLGGSEGPHRDNRNVHAQEYDDGLHLIRREVPRPSPYDSEFEQAVFDLLPEELRANRAAPRTRFDYISNKAVIELTVSTTDLTRAQARLWRLSTERQMHGDRRVYALIMVDVGSGDHSLHQQRMMGRVMDEAALHGIWAVTVRSPEEVADLICRIENDEWPPANERGFFRTD